MKKTSKASSSTAVKRKTAREKAVPAVRQASAPSVRLAALAPKRPADSHEVHAAAKVTVRRLKSQLAEARARIAELEASADTDFLLGIFNRRGFERELQRAIAYIRRYNASGALIVLDVDRLKPINDAFGHAAGDAVLRAVVAALSQHVRSSDLIGRLGGDEFALLLWNLSETDARAKAASLEETIDGLTFTFRDRTVTAGASAGVAILGSHTDAETALEQADSAMYVRKAQRRRD